jgi:hypothetical protein
MAFDWDCDRPDRYNPMDDAIDKNDFIATQQAVNSIGLFVTGSHGVARMTRAEFASLLRVLADSFDRE